MAHQIIDFIVLKPKIEKKVGSKLIGTVFNILKLLCNLKSLFTLGYLNNGAKSYFSFDICCTEFKTLSNDI